MKYYLQEGYRDLKQAAEVDNFRQPRRAMVLNRIKLHALTKLQNGMYYPFIIC